jgi:GNAT superfamily N-acetyltransferase
VQIDHLIDVPGAGRTLAEWFVAEWAPWYGPSGPGDAETDLASCASRDQLPICLVARIDGEIVGTAALRAESAGAELGVGPWLTGLLVAATHRRRGVADGLVAAIENEARRLGFADLYCSVEPQRTLLQRRHWTAFGAASSRRGDLTVYRCRLVPP